MPKNKAEAAACLLRTIKAFSSTFSLEHLHMGRETDWMAITIWGLISTMVKSHLYIH